MDRALPVSHGTPAQPATHAAGPAKPGPPQGMRWSRDQLTPTQRAAHDRALIILSGSPLVRIEGPAGVGKTSVLKALCETTDGIFLSIADFEAVLNIRSPLAYEQAVYEVISQALDAHRIVYIDGIERLSIANWLMSNERRGLFNLVFRALFDRTRVGERQIVISQSSQDLPVDPTQITIYRPVAVNLPRPRPIDYHHIFASRLGEKRSAGIDFTALHHHARSLNAYELNIAASLLSSVSIPTTADVIAIIDRHLQRSNVDVAEVEPIDLSDLTGVEEVVETLERTVLLPFKEPKLAAQLGLESKHGVLLYGPPGSGKTTIGRALAHLMKGKFFIIDGDTNHESGDFFYKVDQIFDRAVANSPSVIFVDDADVILGDPQMQHFGRYLLTKLDGIQGESMGRVCVMMTAMNIADMPAALLRSGRLEVWLETVLPDEQQRRDMIEARVANLTTPLAGFDASTLARHTEGFTPADLRRLVSDAAAHLAFDRHIGSQPRSMEAYLDEAARELRQQKALTGLAANRRPSRGRSRRGG